MTVPTTSILEGVQIPEGFFEEVAAQLETEAADEIADVVIAVCTQRGILHPELDEDPADELRTEQVREVFALLDAVTLAVSDGTIVPSRFSAPEALDPHMASLWSGFVRDADDPLAAAAVSEMLDTGALPAAPTVG